MVKRSTLLEYLRSKPCRVKMRLKAPLTGSARYLDKPPGTLIDEKIKKFTDRFAQDPKKGWELLMAKGDKYSVRQYLKKWFDPSPDVMSKSLT